MKHSFAINSGHLVVKLPKRFHHIMISFCCKSFRWETPLSRATIERLKVQYPACIPAYNWLLKHFDEIETQYKVYLVKELL